MSLSFLRAAALATAFAPCAAMAVPLSLEEALNLAVQRSDASRSANAAIQSVTQAARTAGQLPDPALRIGVDNLPVTGPDRLHTTRDSMTMKRIGISQEWLSPEKRAARQAAADASVEREAVSLQTAVADTRLQTALVYLDAFFAGEAAKLTALMEHHAHEEWEASRARLSSSAGSSQDVLALTAARGVAADETAEVLQQQSAARLTLQRWVGVPADTLTPMPALNLPTEAAYVAAHPTVEALRRDVEVAKKTAAVVATNRQANWTWEVAYGQRSGYADMVSAGVSIPLQLAPAQRQDRETAAQWALVDKAEADLAEATRTVTAEYRTGVSDARSLQERIARYRHAVLTPSAQRTAAATAAYRSNQASLVTLFEARHAEVQAQRKLLALQRDWTKAQVQLTYKPLALGAAP